MHEMTVVSNIMKSALQTAYENDIAHIQKIKIKVGEQHHLAPDLMEYAFSFFTKGTIAREAELVIEKVPIIMICNNCGSAFNVLNRVYICPECGSAYLSMQSGRELILESIEGER